MLKLNLPEYTFNIIKSDNKLKIFDGIRKQYVVLTPEEWVRQNFIQYLISEKKVPPSHIKIESQLKLNQLVKRTDTIVYDKNIKPSVLIEFKAPDVEINLSVFEQINMYNHVLKIKYLVVSNGLSHFYCINNYSENTCSVIKDLPVYENL